MEGGGAGQEGKRRSEFWLAKRQSCKHWALDRWSFWKEALPVLRWGDGAQRWAQSGHVTPRCPSATRGTGQGGAWLSRSRAWCASWTLIFFEMSLDGGHEPLSKADVVILQTCPLVLAFKGSPGWAPGTLGPRTTAEWCGDLS